MLFKKFGGAYIGRQHTLLDKPMGIIAFDSHDIFNLTRIVEYKTRLWQLKVYRPTFKTYPMERLE